jgi:hypothetical protein
MPQTCSVCTHPQRAAINTALSDGGSLRGVAEQFPDISYWALHRHRVKHTAVVSPRREQRAAEQEEEEMRNAVLMTPPTPVPPSGVRLLRYAEVVAQRWETMSMFTIRLMRLGVPRGDITMLWITPGKAPRVLERLNRARLQMPPQPDAPDASRDGDGGGDAA